MAHVASLARLALSDDERERMVRDLTAIVAFAATVQQVETSTPGHAAQELEARLRADHPAPGLSIAEALSNAPDAADGTSLFRVPKVR